MTEVSTRRAGHALDRTDICILSDAHTFYLAEMPFQVWADLQNHPRQRNTERQARKEHFALAKQATGAALQASRHVVAADWQGALYKVDGHARTLLWLANTLPTPNTVVATVHRVDTEDELLELYTVFDVQSAAESIYDRVYGAFRQQGLALQSKRLKHGFLVGALNIALRGVMRSDQDKRTPELNIYKAVAAFKNELTALDAVEPRTDIFFSGVVAAALIALSLDASAIAFFDRLSKGEGERIDERSDPIEAIRAHVLTLKNLRASWINAIQGDLCGRTLGALYAFKEGPSSSRYWFDEAPAPVDIAPVIAAMKAFKGIASDPEL